jgi:hypothetical protein
MKKNRLLIKKKALKALNAIFAMVSDWLKL